MGFAVTTPLWASPLIGHYIDLQYKTDPTWTIVMFFVGVATSARVMWMYLRDFQRENRGSGE